MTLPAQSPADAIEPDEIRPDQDVSSPAAFIAVVAVSALVIILCVLGATLSGLFSFLATSEPAAQESPLTSQVGPSARVAVTSFDDGQWLVGTDVHPGTYATTVPPGSPGCTWERNASTDGTASSVLESGLGKERDRLVVGIRPTDVVFQSQGCGVWQRTGD